MDGERFFGWCAAIVYVATCCVILVGPAETHRFFCDGGGNCLRDWLSVGGSWFGGVATLVTVIYLAQQLIAARLQIEEARREVNDRRRALIQRVINASRSARLALNILKENSNELLALTDPTPSDLYRYTASAETALSRFRSPAFDEAEFVAPVSTLTIATIRNALEAHVSALKAGMKVPGSEKRALSGAGARDDRSYETSYLDEIDASMQELSAQLAN